MTVTIIAAVDPRRYPLLQSITEVEMQRRHFLAGSGALAASLAGITPNKTHAIDPFDRPSPGNLKLSLAAYSMRKYLTANEDGKQEMDLFDFVDFCADQGLPGAELTSYYFPEDVNRKYLLELKRHCHLRGISISGGAIRNDFCQQDEEKLEADIQHTRKWIDYYSVLGAPAIRIFAGKKKADEPLDAALNRCAKVCSQVCRYAARKGVMLALENHGGVTAYAKDLLSIVTQVKSPAFGINFDSGNFRSTEDPYQELEMIAPYAVNAQVKVEITIGGKKQTSDLPRVVEILKNSGYSGWVALEYEAKEEPKEAIPEWLTQLKTMI